MDRMPLFRSKKERSLKKQPQEAQKLLTTPPVEFIETRIVPIGTSEHVYDRAQKKFVVVNPAPPPTATPEKSTLTDFYSSAADAQQQFAQGILIDQPQSEADDMWADVYMAINNAVARYNDVGKVRKTLRKLGKNVPMIQSWMGLFPNSTFSSTLSGGIKLILDSVFRISKIRDEVLSMLSQIPDRIAKTKIATRLYNKPGIEAEKRLHEKSSDLYVAILDAISLIVHWLNTKAEKKFLKAIFQGPDNYGEKVEGKLKDIETIADEFFIEADLCLHNRVSEIQDEVGLVNSKVGSIDTKVGSIDTKVGSIDTKVGSVRDGVKKYGEALVTIGGQNEEHLAQLRKTGLVFDSKLSELQEGMKGQDVILQKLNQRSGTFLNTLVELLGGLLKNRNESQETMRVASRKTFSRDKVLLDLLQAGGTRPDPIASDLKLCFERALSANVVEVDSVNWVLSSTAFKTWISVPFSRILLVNGNSDATSISPMSHLCAFVAESLKVERIPSGMYFCGLRCTSDHTGHKGGPVDLVKSLIVQLMWRFNFDLGFVDQDPPDEKRLNAGEWLCSLLQKLLEQLPAGTVLFWIIDGVSYYERHKIVKTTRLIFRKLIEMLDVRSNVIVKLLVTSPHRSNEVGRIFGAQNTLNLPEVADGDRSGVFVKRLEETASMVPKHHGLMWGNR